MPVPAKAYQAIGQAASVAVGLYSAYKKGSGSSTLTTMRGKNLPVLVEPGEYTRKRRSHGRYKRRTLKRLYRIVATHQQPQWYRFQGKNRFNSGGGNFILYNHLNTSSPGTESLPLFFLELQGCINFNGAVRSPTVMWGIQRNNTATPTYTLVPTPGIADNGTFNYTWELEASPGQTSYPGRVATHKYSDIRMMCYGATATPIKYDISIVTFPDDEYNPFNGQYDMTSASTATVSGIGYTVLDDLLSQYASNPINVQDPKLRSKIRYLFRENFIIQPGSTTDGDAGVPHFRELKIFKKWDEFVRFDWGPTDRADPQNKDNFQKNLTDVKAVPNFDKRKYLMIRATSGYTSSTTVPAPDTSRHPTFDILIRNKWDIAFG